MIGLFWIREYGPARSTANGNVQLRKSKIELSAPSQFVKSSLNNPLSYWIFIYARLIKLPLL